MYVLLYRYLWYLPSPGQAQNLAQQQQQQHSRLSQTANRHPSFPGQLAPVPSGVCPLSVPVALSGCRALPVLCNMCDVLLAAVCCRYAACVTCYALRAIFPDKVGHVR